MSPPGKIKRRFRNTPGHSHYYTTSTDCRKPFLKDDRVCQALADRINKTAEKHNFVILAYVFMPDLIHLLIHPLDEIYSMEVIVEAIKQGRSKRAKNQGWIETDLGECGGGHDSNIFSTKPRSDCIAYIHQNPVRKDMVEASGEYRWSSANWHVQGAEGDIKCQYFSTPEFGRLL